MQQFIAIIEANDDQYAVLHAQLMALNYSTNHIMRYRGHQECIAAQPPVTILLAGSPLACSAGLPALQLLHTHMPHVAIIVLPSLPDRLFDTAAIAQGAQDVLILGDCTAALLEKAITFAELRNKSRQNKAMEAGLYKGHFDDGPVPMWIFDIHSMRFLRVNKAAIFKYGYTQDEFALMTVSDIERQHRLPVLDNRNKAANDNYADAGYSLHKKKNGTEFYVRVYTHAVSVQHGHSRLACAVDVDDKLVAENIAAGMTREIKEQKERLDSILASISDAIWSRDADSLALIYANEAYYSLFGLTEGNDVNIDRFLDRTHPDDREKVLASIVQVKKNGTAAVIYRRMGPGGSTQTLKAKIALKSGINGAPDMINGVTIDFTKETKLHETIKNNEQKLLATINNTRDLIWSVNVWLEIIFCNQPYRDFFLRHYGVPLHEGDYVLGGWHDDAFLEERKRQYARAFAGESFITIVEENFSGRTFYFEISNSPIKDHDGCIIGVNCISRDITEQKKQLIRIHEQNEKLREIAWIQSHRVRGPVASILGLASLFDPCAATNDDNKQILEQVQQATNHLDAIIHEIVHSINKIEADYAEAPPAQDHNRSSAPMPNSA